MNAHALRLRSGPVDLAAPTTVLDRTDTEHATRHVVADCDVDAQRERLLREDDVS